MRFINKPIPGYEGFARRLLTTYKYKGDIPSVTQHYEIPNNMVGYCVRVYPVPHENRHQPPELRHHADCILPSAELASYGYDPMSSIEHVGSLKSTMEKGLDGQVLFNEENLPKYRDAKSAVLSRILTHFLLIEVTPSQAQHFKSIWKVQSKNYNKVTNNCSTFPYVALKQSGIFPNYLFHPITPQRLFSNLKAYLEHNAWGHFTEGYGFVGVDFRRRRLDVRVPQGWQ